MKAISIMNARKFVEVAADAYVRGRDYRPHSPVMKEVARVGTIKFMEPPEDYLDQLWGRCFTLAEADTYKAVIGQLVDALKSGDLPSHKPPLMVVNRGGTTDLDGDSVYLDEFKGWCKQNRLRYPKDWHALVMDATEPQGDPVHIEGTEQPVQLRGKATRKAKIPTRELLDEWAEKFPYDENVGKNQACIAFAKWLTNQKGFPVGSRTIHTWFTWNNRTYQLEPNDKALQRGFENNSVESS
ncbi:hypothetical protein [Acidithiobacillus sulfuriphilus]|uniref:hypothetical protein n=1 Tax=Acidithiobacillus sulfuriphilus TaxID=1867749 RepID=UPI003F60E142